MHEKNTVVIANEVKQSSTGFKRIIKLAYFEWIPYKKLRFFTG
ncbi:hypothetical protein [Legionella impletisoli]|nr:hypothetical protein [Legionella impletisoli]